MDNPLTTGSERLARSFVSPPDGKNCISVKEWVVDVGKADPGIVALVETMERFRDSDYSRNEFQALVTVALKKWETGK